MSTSDSPSYVVLYDDAGSNPSGSSGSDGRSDSPQLWPMSRASKRQRLRMQQDEQMDVAHVPSKPLSPLTLSSLSPLPTSTMSSPLTVCSLSPSPTSPAMSVSSVSPPVSPRHDSDLDLVIPPYTNDASALDLDNVTLMDLIQLPDRIPSNRPWQPLSELMTPTSQLSPWEIDENFVQDLCTPQTPEGVPLTPPGTPPDTPNRWTTPQTPEELLECGEPEPEPEPTCDL